jgi:hypothetical protein
MYIHKSTKQSLYKGSTDYKESVKHKGKDDPVLFLTEHHTMKVNCGEEV